MSNRKPNYGLDAPDVVRRLCLIGVGLLAIGVCLILVQGRVPIAGWFVPTFFGAGGSLIGTGAIMVWGSKFGKLRLRDKYIANLSLQGSERVLDVGCGHGLMLLGAAKKLTTGRAVGIDLWQKEDQAGNSKEATLENAALEGVKERVELHDGDARQMSFEKESFDVILSSWALHNIYDGAGRRQALEEIARVLKPGGRILIVDIRHAQEYADVLRSLGLADAKVSAPNFTFVIPSRCVGARKARE